MDAPGQHPDADHSWIVPAKCVVLEHEDATGMDKLSALGLLQFGFPDLPPFLELL